VKEKVKEKQNAYAMFIHSRMDEELEVNKIKYKVVKKKAVNITKNNVFERLYKKLKTKEGQKNVFNLSQVRERKTRDL